MNLGNKPGDYVIQFVIGAIVGAGIGYALWVHSPGPHSASLEPGWRYMGATAVVCGLIFSVAGPKLLEWLFDLFRH